MLDLFKQILKDNSTVRQTEELARQAKGEIQQREPRAKTDRLHVPELDEMAKNLATKHEFDKVSIYQSGTQGRIVMIIKGDPEKTAEKIKAVYEILSK